MDTALVALRVLLSLGAVLALLWYAQRRLTRSTAKRRGKAADLVTVVGRQSVGIKASVVVVDIDGARFVLGVTEHTVSVLHSADLPSEAQTAQVESPDAFASTLAGVTHIDSANGPQLQLRPRRNTTVQGNGSILSPATWKQTAAAIRQIR